MYNVFNSIKKYYLLFVHFCGKYSRQFSANQFWWSKEKKFFWSIEHFNYIPF